MEIRKKKDVARGPYRGYDLDNLTKAYMAVKDNTMSIRKAALSYGVPKTTLIDRLSGRIDIDVLKPGTLPLFSQEQEALLARHLQTMSEVGYGYSRQETINLASDYAVNLGLRDKAHPLNDRWLYKFLGRWPELNVKKPRSLDVARAKCATREAIDNCFDTLNQILVKYHLVSKPHLIYNVDEKGLSTEHKPPKIVSGKHHKTQTISAGKSKNVTVIGCVNGVGQQVPPYFVFPGMRMLDSLLNGASAGADGTVSPTGWSNTEVFAMYMKDHLLKYLPSRSPEEPVLILYDGHKSHVSLNLIEWAKAENIILFVLPPHCSHLLQPLDVSCFGPFEVAWNSAVHNYMRVSGGRLVTRYDVAELACKVYSTTLTLANIQSAFRRSGIYPFDHHVISDLQVAPSTTFSRECDVPAQALETANETTSAECFLQQRGGKVLENVQKASKVRNTLSKIVGGKAITEEDIVDKIKTHKQNYGKGKKILNKRAQSPKPSTKVKKPRNALAAVENFESSDEEEVAESEKSIICNQFYPDISKRPYVMIVSWGQCDKCAGWVHLSFCTSVKVIRRGDTFMCPSCESN